MGSDRDRLIIGTGSTVMRALEDRGVELNELIDAVRKAGPEKESIYKFVECHFKAGESVPVLTKAYNRASYSVKQKSL